MRFLQRFPLKIFPIEYQWVINLLFANFFLISLVFKDLMLFPTGIAEISLKTDEDSIQCGTSSSIFGERSQKNELLQRSLIQNSRLSGKFSLKTRRAP